MAVSLEDSSVVNLTTNSPGRYDGVIIDARGNVYVATHTDGATPPCRQAGEIESNSAGTDIADLVCLLDYMFNGGSEPPSCL